MSPTIWRFTLAITDEQRVSMPKGAVPLSVAPSRFSGDELDVWAACDSAAPVESRRFLIFGTGNPVQHEPGRFVGTCQTHGGSLVWHVFLGADEAPPLRTEMPA